MFARYHTQKHKHKLTREITAGGNGIEMIIVIDWYHGGSDSTDIKRRQQQLGRMADILPSVTFSIFDL